MFRLLAGGALAITGSAAAAASETTDFGVRAVGGGKVLTPIVQEGQPDSATYRPLSSGTSSTSLAAAARLGARWGRVTSLRRSPERNRRVGGVPNSYHLSGRAIDIARRGGVTHAQIAAAYRAAGYRIVESLDEGDHSHFAFAFGEPVRMAAPAQPKTSEVTTWAVVYAPGAARR